MLSEQQVSEIRELLDSAQNPISLFDNDQDGLCSFVLLRRFCGKGKAFPVKSAPMDDSYFKKVEEFDADAIFILDVPRVSDEFFSEARKLNLPVVWIDHHDNDPDNVPEWVHYYNPFVGKNIPSATTYLCQQISEKKEDLWLALIGCISDNFVPAFYSEFKEKYPDLSIQEGSAMDVYYKSDLGKVCQILGAGLKDRTTNVVKMMDLLVGAKSPYEILQENENNEELHEKFKEVDRKFRKFSDKALSEIDEDSKLIFFEYGGETSMSAAISNYLKYLYPEKILFVAYLKEGFVNISGRGDNVRDILLKVLDEMENAKGGGHEKAVGARIMRKDLDFFKKRVEELAS